MAWTTTDLDTIRKAIAGGVRKVTFADGRSTEYQSLDQMLAVSKVIQAELEMQAAGTAVVRRRVPYYKSGL